MASTFSNLGLNLQATGENSGTWGAITNVNLQDIDNAISGVVTVTVTGNTTLAFTTNSSSTTFTDEAGRNKIIVLSGSLSATTITITVPNIEKDYVIINNSGATATISAGGSTTVSIATGGRNYVYVNGASAVATCIPADLPGGTSNAIQYNSAGAFAGSTNFTFDGTNVVSLLNNGALRLYNTAGTFYTGLKVAAAAAATATFTLPSADGTANQVLQTNGSGVLSFATVSGGAAWQAVQSTSFTATVKYGYFVNTSSAAITMTLPASPTIGDFISVIDYYGTFDTNNLTVSRNGKPIQGTAEDLTVATERAGFTLVYSDTTNGWLLQNN